MRIVAISLLFMLLAAVSQADQILEQWKRDFSMQPISKRPKLEARYADGSRTAALIEAENYTLTIDLKSKDGQKISKFLINGKNVLGANGIYLAAKDSNDAEFSSLKALEASRINIYRRGPYYIEVHWLDVTLNDGKTTLPIKGEVVLHCYPEKVHISTILHMTEDLKLNSASLVIKGSPESTARPESRETFTDYLQGSEAILADGAFVVGCVAPGGFQVTSTSGTSKEPVISYYLTGRFGANWKKDDKRKGHLLLFPMVGDHPERTLEAEMNPIPQDNLKAEKGQMIGYDLIKGCYTVRTDNPGHFSYHFYKNRNDYETAVLSVVNDKLRRKVYFCHETGNNPGAVECGVLLDEKAELLPITVQISKNFAGEIEEPFYNPKDIPFSETFFPLYLNPGETRKVTSHHLYQDWGNHPLKQFSSLGAWMDYYHMSTGVTETTCYVPFNFAGPSGVSIADFRPMSQKMWDSQPQHDNVAGHSFLRYKDGKDWHYLEYTGTTFRSTGPNWADMSMNYLSDDGKVKVTCDVFEMPHTDELRNFIRMKIDILKDLKVGDMAQDFRILNIATWVQSLRYKSLAYTGENGQIIETPIKLDDSFTVSGALLGGGYPFACVYPCESGNNSYIIRRFEGTLDTKPVKPAVSLLSDKKGDTILMLVPDVKTKWAKAGDHIEIDLCLMPYGDEKNTYQEPVKVRVDYGENAPKMTQVAKGTKYDDFPCKIRCDESDTAEFTITGGFNYIPIIVIGFSDYRGIQLYELVEGKEMLVDHKKLGGDGCQVFVEDGNRFGSVFLFNTDGKEHMFRARR